MECKELAQLLFPGIEETPAEIRAAYPPRDLPDGALVTRFAPSPTGMLHIGGLYAALCSERLAHQSGGRFFLRIEDTDQKRLVPESLADILESLEYFGIRPDESVTGADSETGRYGPYLQSRRGHIYRIFVKSLVQRGLAYPCFCTEPELERQKEIQERSGSRPGYYGKWAVHRDRPLTELAQLAEQGLPYAIRLKAPGRPDRRVRFTDLLKGTTIMPENDQDIVILKSDGLPTYHFAHAVDDGLMGTTHVIRGDEWLPSVPLHLQLFGLLGFEPPRYGHIAPLMKQDGNSRRKFSKRLDSDAAAAFYREQGYPGPAVVEYLLQMLNSNFEAWRAANPRAPYDAFPVRLDKIGGGGALFNLSKLNDVSRNRIAAEPATEVYRSALAWADRYDPGFAGLMRAYPAYTLAILGIERDGAKPSKDLAKWSELREGIGYFYDELFDGTELLRKLPESLAPEAARTVLESYLEIYDPAEGKTDWFERLRRLALDLGYAADAKSFREHPERYAGSVADLAAALRWALTGRRTTPDLHQIMRVLGAERVRDRLARAASRCVAGPVGPDPDSAGAAAPFLNPLGTEGAG